jgi:hypothetical protein
MKHCHIRQIKRQGAIRERDPVAVLPGMQDNADGLIRQSLKAISASCGTSRTGMIRLNPFFMSDKLLPDITGVRNTTISPLSGTAGRLFRGA